jgi:hypothetical protein
MESLLGFRVRIHLSCAIHTGWQIIPSPSCCHSIERHGALVPIFRGLTCQRWRWMTFRGVAENA